MAVTSVSKTKPSTGPKTLDILIKALQELDERKGVSIPAIKNYIITNYPDKDPLKVKTSLRKAIEKGFQDELLVRPKSSETAGSGMTGRLKLNKVKMAEKEKSAKLKEKKKAQAEKKAAKPTTKKTTKKPSEGKAKDAKTKAVKKTTAKTKKSPAKTKSPKTPVKKVKKDAKAPKTAEKAKMRKTPKTPMKAKQTKSAKSKGKA